MITMRLPRCSRLSSVHPVSIEYAIHGFYGTIRNLPEINLTQGSVTPRVARASVTGINVSEDVAQSHVRWL